MRAAARGIAALACAALLTTALAGAAAAQSGADAHRELTELCEADGGRLWERSLCGPLMIVDPNTREAWASQADQAGILARAGDGWAGKLPERIPIANTSVEWGGVRWIMLVSPLPEDEIARRVMLAHEAWHRIQSELGLAAQPSDCAHLETERGRYFMRLEMRALEAALSAQDETRWGAALQALLFRSMRLNEFPDAEKNETALDRNEGLAEYTGVRLGAGESAFTYAAKQLRAYDRHEALARSYAYATGPAYGLLLDIRAPGWRRALSDDTPADKLHDAFFASAVLFPGRLVEIAALRYGGPEIAAQERERAAANRARLGRLRSRFAEGPRLILPLRSVGMEFDPNKVTPIEGVGSYYEMLTLRDAWGELRVTQGAIIAADFKSATVAEPDSHGLSGPGWVLSLNAGFHVSRVAEGVLRVESAQ
jgi:hypothetical protein